MKKIIFSISLIACTPVLFAQSLEQGTQQLYYERYQSAENSFHQVLQQQPDNASSWYYLTRTYLLEGKPVRAKDSLLLAPSTIYQDPWYVVAYGTLLLFLHNKDSASLYFNQALDRTRSKDAGILSAIARAHVESSNGDAAYAVELLQKALKKDKHNPEIFTILGDAYLKQSNGTEAYKAYKSALEENDHYAVAYHKLGEIFVTQKNPEMYVEYFNKAIAADASYAPSYYRLYVYYFYKDLAMAQKYYNDYMAKSDPSIQQQYDLTDLYYLNKQYDQAINKAQEIFKTGSDQTKPRLYKLIAYSYEGLKDSSRAFSFLQQYFQKEVDSNILAKDYKSMADLMNSKGFTDSAMAYLEKATLKEKDSSMLYGYYKNLAMLAKQKKDYSSQAKWLGRYYEGNEKATNVDLFSWALAHYLAAEYVKADTVFGTYIARYPEQSFGYYWRARTNAAIDTGMKLGLARPYYEKLVSMMQKDTKNSNYKKWLTEAYGYLAAYEANTQKDYAEAIDYFEKVLEVDPGNESAKRYITVLQKTDDGSK